MASMSPETDAPDATPLARFWAPLLLAIVVLVVWLTGVRGQFLFDDLNQIVGNDRIQQADQFGALMRRSQRPFTDLTFWINARLGGENPVGYHLVNCLIHLGSTLALFGLIRQALRRSSLNLRSASIWFAFGCALVWAVHPLHTQAVTYIVQRAEAMASLFYLLTLYSVMRSAGAARVIWSILAIACCALGMMSKPVMVTAPVAALLLDRCFIAGSFAAALRRRWPLYIGLAATWLILVFTGTVQGVLSTDHAGSATVGFSYRGVTPLDYLLTQPAIILQYLRLAVWPDHLVLDYGWQPGVGMVGMFVLAILLLATIVLLWVRPRIGFVAAMFFLILAPTSSFVPIRDLAFEHRMYLPLASIVILVMLGLFIGLPRLIGAPIVGRMAAVGVIVIAAALSARTVVRNGQYAEPWRLWEANTISRPLNIRAHNQYGSALMRAANRTAPPLPELVDKVESARLTAIAIDPEEAGLQPTDQDVITAQYQAGVYYVLRAQLDPSLTAMAAEPFFRRTLELAPDHEGATWQLGRLLLNAGEPEDAMPYLLRARTDQPDDQLRHRLVGRAAAELEDWAAVFGAYKRAVELAPRDPTVYYEWSQYAAETHVGISGRINALKRTIELVPSHFRANFDLGGIYREQGDPAAAAQHLAVAVRSEPTSVAAQINLGNALLDQNTDASLKSAVGAFKRATTLDSQSVAAHFGLGLAHARLNEGPEAAAALRRTLELQPDHADARTVLTDIERQIGR